MATVLSGYSTVKCAELHSGKLPNGECARLLPLWDFRLVVNKWYKR